MHQQQREEENPKIGRIQHTKFNSGGKKLQPVLQVKVFYSMFYETMFDFIVIVTLLLIVF